MFFLDPYFLVLTSCVLTGLALVLVRPTKVRTFVCYWSILETAGAFILILGFCILFMRNFLLPAYYPLTMAGVFTASKLAFPRALMFVGLPALLIAGVAHKLAPPLTDGSANNVARARDYLNRAKRLWG